MPDEEFGTYGTRTVGTTASQIVASNDRASVLVQNVSSNTLYVGLDSGVTTANGIRLNPGDSINFDDYTGTVHGVASAAASDIRYCEIGR